MNYQKKKIQGTIPFMITLKGIKYQGINLTKKVKDLYTENYNTLLQETEKETNKWKRSPYSGLKELALSRCPYCLKQSADSM